MSAFFSQIPKAELHIHIEGSLEPEMMFALADRNNIQIPYKSVAEIRAAYNFQSLQSFIGYGIVRDSKFRRSVLFWRLCS